MCHGADYKSYGRQHGNPSSINLRRTMFIGLSIMPKTIRDSKLNRLIRYLRRKCHQLNEEGITGLSLIINGINFSQINFRK